jgi:DNA polymerase theta
VQVSQQQRDHAKQLTYGLLYGMGAVKLADELGCSVAEARSAQERFRASLPGIEAWQARVVADCRRLGYVEVRAAMEAANIPFVD